MSAHGISSSRTIIPNLTQWIAVVPAYNETNSEIDLTLDLASSKKSDLIECKPFLPQ